MEVKIEFDEQIMERNQEEFKVDMKLIEKLHTKLHHRKQAIGQLQSEMAVLKSQEHALQDLLEKNKDIYANKLADAESRVRFLEKNINTLKSQAEKMQQLIFEQDRSKTELKITVEKLNKELNLMRQERINVFTKMNRVFAVDDSAQNRHVIFRSASPDTLKTVNVTLINQKNCIKNLFK